MNDVIPLKINQNMKADANKGLSGLFSGLPIDQNSLMPILFIFMNNKNGAGLDIFNNFSNLQNSFGGIFSKLNLTTENIERSLKTLNDIKPLLGPSNNAALIGTVSTVLETVYKVNTIQELTNNLGNISNPSSSTSRTNDDSNSDFKSSNKDINYKILDAVSELLDGDSKKSVKQAGEMMRTVTMIQDMTNVFGGEGTGGKGFNIAEILKLITPLIGGQSNNFQGMGDMGDIMKMMDMFSIFNNNTPNNNKSNESEESNSKVTNHSRKKKNKFNKENVIDIDEYDEETNEDNRIDELLDDLIAD